ncbi:Cilia- and flagella-associated protein 73 [Nowakowskiella sp. JEL0078]|nr:Cilia- and flagella-associated protein 73 [Nowakowskiella sp. JEL0078]
MDERKTRELKEFEIQKLKENQATILEVRDRQSSAVDRNMVFQRFLESVLENTDEFGETKDILSRYDTLAATNLELIDRAREAQERTERDRIAFMISTEAKLEESQSRSAKWQSEWDLTLKNATQKSLLLGQIKMATNNLFNLVKTHLNTRLNNTQDTLVQLEKIQQFMLDLTAISNDMQSFTEICTNPLAAKRQKDPISTNI